TVGPSYSCTRVKVGLVTSSSKAAPSAAAIPLTSVVLPAPTSPERITSLGGRSISAIVSPRASVPATDLVLNRFSRNFSFILPSYVLSAHAGSSRRSMSVRLHLLPDIETHPTDV